MLSSWKAALTSRAALAGALIVTAVLSAPWGYVSAAGKPAPAQEVGDTLGTARPWISKVRWEGLNLLDAVAVERDSYLRAGEQLSDSSVDLELGRIESLCFTAGLLGARAAVDTTMRGEAVEITMRISEGSRTKTGEVTVSGSEVIPDEELAGRLGVSAGAWFDPVALESSMTGLLEELNRSGYPYAQVWMTGFEYDAETNTVDLTFAVYGGEESIVEMVVFDGLTKTDTALALRTSRLVIGERFDEEKLSRARRYLSASDIFVDVGQAEVRRLGPGRVDVRIPVEEIKRGNSIQGIFGFAKKEDEGYISNGSVDITLRNIGGSGRDVDFRWLNDGLSFQTLYFRYSEDFFFSLPPGFEAELRQDVYDTLYDYTLVGFDMSLDAGPGSELLAGYTWDNNVPQTDPRFDRSVRHRVRAGVRTLWPKRAAGRDLSAGWGEESEGLQGEPVPRREDSLGQPRVQVRRRVEDIPLLRRGNVLQEGHRLGLPGRVRIRPDVFLEARHCGAEFRHGGQYRPGWYAHPHLAHRELLTIFKIGVARAGAVDYN
jgi:hypothetical protein